MPTTRPREARVAIIGAGFSGIIAAVKLQGVGLDSYVIYEKAERAGGVWRQRYPGISVDVPSHLYSFSFMRHYDWPQSHATAEQLRDYLDCVIQDFDLAKRIQYGVDVREVVWNSDTSTYRVQLDDGTAEEFDFVISAVGLFHTPMYPSWPGIDEFGGEKYHTAEWPEEFDCRGKTVAVVGTGSTSVQVVPHLAREADKLYVFQREPGWMIPKPFRVFTPEERRQFMRPFGTLAEKLKWQYRFETLITGVRRPGPINTKQQQICADHIVDKLAGHPELIEAVTPKYAFGGKRPIFDLPDDSFYTALTCENVELVPRAVVSMTPTGIVDADGHERTIDVLVMATGFRVTEFLKTIKVIGRGGRTLNDVWNGEPRAFLGMMVPRFPNFFMFYGPNTNGATKASMLEAEGQFIVRAIRDTVEKNKRYVEVEPLANDLWDWYVTRAIAKSTVTSTNNYYTVPTGKVVTEWVGTHAEYWAWTKLLRKVATKVR